MPPVNLLGALDGFNQGREIREQNQQRQTLKDIGNTFATQGAGAASKLAFSSGNLGIGMKLEAHQQAQLDRLDANQKAKMKEVSTFIATGMLSTKDPAQRENILNQAAQKYGENFVADYRGGNHQRAIIESTGIANHLAGQRADRNFNATQSFRNQSLGLRRQGLDIQRQKASAPSKRKVMKLDDGSVVEVTPGGLKTLREAPKGGVFRKMSVTEKKAVLDADDQVHMMNNGISALTRALELSKDANNNVVSRFIGGAEIALGGGDKADQNTAEMKIILDREAITDMARTLKGVTTDFELREFKKLSGAESHNPKVRAKIISEAIKILKKGMARQKKKAAQLRGGTFFHPQDEQDTPQPKRLKYDPNTGEIK